MEIVQKTLRVSRRPDGPVERKLLCAWCGRIDKVPLVKKQGVYVHKACAEWIEEIV